MRLGEGVLAAQQLGWRVRHHEVRARGASMAFYLMLAIAPALLGLLGVLSFLDLDNELILLQGLIDGAMPPEVASVLQQELGKVLDVDVGRPLTLALLLTGWYVSRAVGAGVRGVQTAWQEEQHTWLAQRLLGFGAAWLVILGTVVALVALTTAGWLLNWTVDQGWVPSQLAGVLTLVRWPVLALLFQQAVNLIFRLGHPTYARWGFFSTGSLLATVGWILVTQAFELYVQNVADLGATYGSLGTAVGLLVYLHLVATGILLGAELDALLEDRRLAAAARAKSQKPPPPVPQVQPPGSSAVPVPPPPVDASLSTR